MEPLSVSGALLKLNRLHSGQNQGAIWCSQRPIGGAYKQRTPALYLTTVPCAGPEMVPDREGENGLWFGMCVTGNSFLLLTGVKVLKIPAALCLSSSVLTSYQIEGLRTQKTNASVWLPVAGFP
ncbi:hypothetical protein KIL84_004370 [Mauremys mutica]|uniref:Uncharacterized protein n=1 Tax=Mauremys mutica TaxID=74926 RepID=A0A9D4B688_9SAUR|nr:hypothetical protein KIL84_004370 [Mauremys mutica]